MTASDPFAAGCQDAQDHASPTQARDAARKLRPVLTAEQQAIADEVGQRTRREAGLSLEHVEDEAAAGAAVAAMREPKTSSDEKRPPAA